MQKMSKDEFLKLLEKDRSRKNKYNVAPKEARIWEGMFRGRKQEILFDSLKEKNRFIELLILEKRGEICNLSIKERFPIGVKNRVYESDFYYFDLKKKRWVIEDTKGVLTDVAKIKIDAIQQNYPEIAFILL